MNKEKVIIGALVGMGPNSTSLFYDCVMEYARKLYGAKLDIDFPEMILISLQYKALTMEASILIL